MTDLIPASDMPTIFPGLSTQYWNALRFNGGGPVYVKIGRKIFYRRDDIDSWIKGNTYARTDKPVKAGAK